MSGANRCGGERGALGGAEVLPFLFLVFVTGMLVIFNAWLVVDARLGAASAAREGARTLVEHDADSGVVEAQRRVVETLEAYGSVDGEAVTQTIGIEDGAFGRCARVTVTVTYEAPFISAPFLGGIGSRTVSASHSELIDPFRDGDFEGTC